MSDDMKIFDQSEEILKQVSSPVSNEERKVFRVTPRKNFIREITPYIEKSGVVRVKEGSFFVDVSTEEGIAVMREIKSKIVPSGKKAILINEYQHSNKWDTVFYFTSQEGDFGVVFFTEKDAQDLFLNISVET